MAQRAGAEGAIVAVEPQADNFALLNENIAANGLSDRIRALQSVVAPPGLCLVANQVEANSGATYFLHNGDGAPGSHLGIDDIASMTFLPDIIKLDIEGLEFAVLESASLVRDTQPILYAEVSPFQLARYDATVGDLDVLLRSYRYLFFKNAGARNAANDSVLAIELDHLSDGGKLFDVLAVHSGSPRLESILF
jgi:FkbM family methyltransferase